MQPCLPRPQSPGLALREACAVKLRPGCSNCRGTTGDCASCIHVAYDSRDASRHRRPLEVFGRGAGGWTEIPWELVSHQAENLASALFLHQSGRRIQSAETLHPHGIVLVRASSSGASSGNMSTPINHVVHSRVFVLLWSAMDCRLIH